MAGPSKIEWTEVTWNPVTGCTKLTPGCDNCYAARFAERFRNTPGHPYEQGFDLRLHENRLEAPLKWKKPRTVFVNSMSDLFHVGVPTGYVDRVFDVMEEASRHTFQVLTKRSGRMQKVDDSTIPGQAAARSHLDGCLGRRQPAEKSDQASAGHPCDNTFSFPCAFAGTIAAPGFGRDQLGDRRR